MMGIHHFPYEALLTRSPLPAFSACLPLAALFSLRLREPCECGRRALPTIVVIDVTIKYSSPPSSS